MSRHPEFVHQLDSASLDRKEFIYINVNHILTALGQKQKLLLRV